MHELCHVAQIYLTCRDLLWVDVSPLEHAEEQLADTAGVTEGTRNELHVCLDLPVRRRYGNPHTEVLEDLAAAL